MTRESKLGAQQSLADPRIGFQAPREFAILLCLTYLSWGCQGSPRPTTASRSSSEPVPANTQKLPSPTTTDASPALAAKKPYDFRAKFAAYSLPLWEKLMAPYKGKPNIRFLEIGLGEGETTFWMLDNVLTDPTSSVVGIDVFSGVLKNRFFKNLEISGAAAKVQVIVEPSQDRLGALPRDSFDIIYVDGSHSAPDVLTDAVLSWPLLKGGGLMIFDDYLMALLSPGPERSPESSPKYVHSDRVPYTPMEMSPRVSIDAFVTAFRNSLEVVYRGYQVVLRKKEAGECLFIEQYRYCWGEKRVRKGKGGPFIQLTRDEEKLLQLLFIKRPFGEIEFVPGDEIRSHPGFGELKRKLGLSLQTPGPSPG